MIKSVLGFSFLHFVAQIMALAFSFSVGMSQFDTGEPAGLFGSALGAISALLMLPLALPLVRWWPFGATGFPLEHLPFILNSLVWGVGLAFARRKWRARREATPGPPAA